MWHEDFMGVYVQKPTCSHSILHDQIHGHCTIIKLNIKIQCSIKALLI
jgi:hypothetical protein